MIFSAIVILSHNFHLEFVGLGRNAKKLAKRTFSKISGQKVATKRFAKLLRTPTEEFVAHFL